MFQKILHKIIIKILYFLNGYILNIKLFINLIIQKNYVQYIFKIINI